jgi:hypothetical protein
VIRDAAGRYFAGFDIETQPGTELVTGVGLARGRAD